MSRPGRYGERYQKWTAWVDEDLSRFRMPTVEQAAIWQVDETTIRKYRRRRPEADGKTRLAAGSASVVKGGPGSEPSRAIPLLLTQREENLLAMREAGIQAGLARWPNLDPQL